MASWWVVPEGTVGDIINSLSQGFTNKKIAHVVEAATKPANSIAGPFPDAARAQAVADTYNQTASTYQGPAQQLQSGFNTIGSGIGDVTGLKSIGDFFHRLTEGQTWTRVGEVALGGILLYAGVRALSRGTTAGRTARTATKPVKSVTRTASKVIMPEVRTAQAVRRTRQVERARTAEQVRRRAQRAAATRKGP